MKRPRGWLGETLACTLNVRVEKLLKTFDGGLSRVKLLQFQIIKIMSILFLYAVVNSAISSLFAKFKIMKFVFYIIC